MVMRNLLLNSLRIKIHSLVIVLQYTRFGYVHRDIKLDNILIKSHAPLKIKIIDFGFAEKINRDKLVNGQGTAGYIAPELFDSSPYTENCEIFSLGILFFILLSGNSPFRSANYEGNISIMLSVIGEK